MPRQPRKVIIAFDPGGTCGYAIFNAAGKYTSGEIKTPNKEYEIDKILRDIEPGHIVYERFDHRMRDKVDLSGAYQIGVLRLWSQSEGVGLIEQTPAYAKNFWKDDKLKALEVYKTAMPHANDAMRHLLAYKLFRLRDNALTDLLKDIGEVP